MRYVGIDFGEKRFGIAISDPLMLTAQSFRVIPAKLSDLLQVIEELRAQNDKLEIVVGLPKNLKGANTKSTQKVLGFVEKLEQEIKQQGWPIEVRTHDERFSTVAAQKTLIEADLSRQKRKKVIDGLAAQFMLQGYLDQTKK